MRYMHCLILALVALGLSSDVSVAGPRATAPAERIAVTGSVLRLGEGRNLLKAPDGTILPAGSVDSASVGVSFAGQRLSAGTAYKLVEGNWYWSIERLPECPVPLQGEVLVDFAYSLLRLDSVARDERGQDLLVPGISHLTTPRPPPLPEGYTRAGNIFVTYHSDGSNVEWFPVLSDAAEAETRTTAGPIPATLRKLERGEAVRIVCWGDSVTAGGNAGAPSNRYVRVFERLLKESFPDAAITVSNISVGGSTSMLWVFPDEQREMIDRNPRFEACRWERIEAARPDLVTVLFVNDAYYSQPLVDRVYGEIKRRLEAIGAEMILVTPHFVSPVRMVFGEEGRTREGRPYVRALIHFAAENRVALADASARWEHLWREGLPYSTLLGNGFNHPDDRGHRLFAEELIKCFRPE